MFDFLLVMLTLSSPIILIVLISKYFKYKSETSKQLLEVKQLVDSSNVQQLTDEVKALKERTEVLEKIVTDQRFELNQKLSSLA